jgi:4-hydroxy-tetrahydrodipicolinate reductase
LGEVLGIPELNISLCGSAEEALQTACDVFVEYTQPEVAKANVSAAIRQGAHVVLGTSGLADDDLDELGESARQRKVGLLAVGNFSTAAMVLSKSAELAARYLPQWEILDYASATKPDAPSGTSRELAFKLSQVREPEITIPIERTQGRVESRGATLHGIQVHAVRLPGHVLSVEVVFGTGDEKLSIRYDAGTSPEPYVEGALAAIRRVNTFIGLKRGLDSVMDA